MNTQPTQEPLKQNAGIALITTIIFLVVLALIVTMVASRVFNQNQQVDNFGLFQNAYLGVTSGYDEADAKNIELGIDTPWNFAVDGTPLNNPAKVNALMTAYAAAHDPQLASMPNVQYSVIRRDKSGDMDDGVDNDADGDIDEDDEGVITMYITGRQVQGDTVQIVRQFIYTELNLENVNVWNNAIFAGVQQTGNVINGNVDIHGSIHILGDTSVLGDISVVLPEVAAFSGASGIFNNYDEMTPSLEAEIPVLERDANNEETLKAKLRVRIGKVSINGNTSIGEASADPGSKSNMDGVFVSDGWAGNKSSGGEPVAGVVFSDNGHSEAYDLGGSINFPYFAETLTTGQTYFDGTLASYYMESLNVYTGDVSLDSVKTQGGPPSAIGDSFYYNSTTGVGCVNGIPGAVVADPADYMPTYAEMTVKISNDPAVDEYFIWFNANKGTAHENVLYINGRVAIDGMLTFSGPGPITYEGKGTILVFDSDDSYNGSILADGTIVPCGNGAGDCDGTVNIETSLIVDDGNPATRSFPATNLIGIMSEFNFVLGVSSQISIMGGFYAQSGISVNKQTEIIGTIVGDYFDMGGQVPRIYQVPTLADEWEDDMRMIGDNPVMEGGTKVWFEVGVPL